MGHLDFSLSSVVLYALMAGAALPLYLLATARLPVFAGRNALQFLISVLVMMTFWLGVSFLWPGSSNPAPADMLVALMILAGATLLYLEAWALLSRGYTLGLLLTLLQAGRPLTGDELAHSYRGGDGLSWIMKHRLSGLVGAGLVKNKEGMITLTVFPGVFVAWLYKVGIAILGLHRTG